MMAALKNGRFSAAIDQYPDVPLKGVYNLRDDPDEPAAISYGA
jgi:hypothetical protein